MSKQELKQELLRARRDELGIKYITKLTSRDAESRLDFTDEIAIPEKHAEVGNAKMIETTVGRYLFNVIVLGRELIEQMGFVNEPITKKVYSRLEERLGEYMIENKINTKQYGVYLDRLFWFAFTLSPITTPSISYDMLTPNEKVIARRDELLEKYSEQIEQGDISIVNEIEKELLELARAEIGDKAGSDLLDVGMKKPSMAQIKEMTIMRGAMPSSENDGSYKISRNNLAEGIDWKEYPEYANLAINGSWQRARATAKGGYSAKQIAAAGQAIVIGPENSDCKTSRTLRVRVATRDEYYLRYIVDGERLVLLDSDTIGSYIGKEVDMRSPMFCEYDDNKVCEACMGTFYRATEIEQPAATVARLGTNLMQIAMSQFHDSSVKTTQINDLDQYLSD